MLYFIPFMAHREQVFDERVLSSDSVLPELARHCLGTGMQQ